MLIYRWEMVGIGKNAIYSAGIGGQALPGGVMFHRGGRAALALRLRGGGIHTVTWRLPRIPRPRFLRGAGELAVMLVFSLRGLYESLRLLPKTGLHSPLAALRYHGAEHKTLNCLRRGLPLSLENTRSSSRIHPLCGTVLITFALLAELIALLVIPKRFYEKLGDVIILISFIAGALAGYGLSSLALRRPSRILRLLTAPGRLAQRLTTLEPRDCELACAAAALEALGNI